MSVVNSILMTVFNRPPRVLWNTLHALRKNDLTGCEVLVVDDGSAVDYSQQRAYTEQYEMPVRWLRIEPSEYPDWTYTIPHPKGGVINNPARAWNVAINESKGRRLMFLSSDCMVPNFAVKQAKTCGEHFWIASVVDQASNIMYVCDRRAVPLYFFSSCLKKHVEAIGGFDEEFLRGIAFEDNDFGAALGLKTGHVLFDMSVLVVHQSHPPLAYSDEMEGFRTNENYIKKKWNGIPWNDRGVEDPIELRTYRKGDLFCVNPRLKASSG